MSTWPIMSQTASGGFGRLSPQWQDLEAGDLDQDDRVVERAAVVRRIGDHVGQPPGHLGPVVNVVAAVGDMLVGDAGDLHIGERVGADQPVQQHVGAYRVQAVMIEVRVRGQGDIDLQAGKS